MGAAVFFFCKVFFFFIPAQRNIFFYFDQETREEIRDTYIKVLRTSFTIRPDRYQLSFANFVRLNFRHAQFSG